MGPRTRLAELAYGAPLGSHPLTRDAAEPYSVYAARRKSRFARFALAALAALALSATTFAAVAFAANLPGYWVRVEYSSQAAGGTGGGDAGHVDPSRPPSETVTYKATWQWFAKDGSSPDRIKVDGVEVDNPVHKTGTAATGRAPSVPEGWYKCYRDSMSPGELEQNRTEELPDPDSPAGQNPMWDKTIRDNPPEFELSTSFITNILTSAIHGLFRAPVEFLCSLGDWMLGIVGANAEDLFTQPFQGGTFARFYDIAQKVSTFAVQPYALVMLAVAFVVGLLHVSDPRRRLAGADWLEEMLMLTAMFMVCTTLILHAIDLCAAVYWLAQNLVRGVSIGLSEIGVDVGALGSQTLSGPIMAGYDQLTYAQGGAVFVYALLGLVALFVAGACTVVIISTIFVRVGEIYLRAAASPFCLSLLVDERTRASGMGYVKRFCAVCFQAAIIFVALALAPLFIDVATTFVGDVGLTGIPGISEILATVIPTICALLAVTSVVRASEPVANSMFGLA